MVNIGMVPKARRQDRDDDYIFQTDIARSQTLSSTQALYCREALVCSS